MKILAIGGSGWIGRSFVKLALSEGHAVSVLSRGKKEIPEGAVLVKADRDTVGDLRDLSWDGGAAPDKNGSWIGKDDWDMVIDFMGKGQKHAVQMLGVDGLGIQNIFISSDLVYSPRQATYPLTETESRYQTRFFGGDKYQAEWLFNSGSSKRYTVVLRPNYLYGPGKPLGCLPPYLDDADLIGRIRRKETLCLPGGGRSLVQPVFIEDFSRMILALGQKKEIRARKFNVSGPETIEARRFYEAIGEALGYKVNIKEEPVDTAIAVNPEWEQYCRHRFCSTLELERSGLPLPETTLAEGLKLTLSGMI